MVKNLTHPLILAAVLCAVLVYSGAVRLASRSPFVSIFAPRDIVRMEGRMVSNPSKTAAQGGSYRADFAPEKVFTQNGALSEARGVVSVLVPPAIAEAYYPGKLYTAAKNGVLAENGARLSLSVRAGFRENEFTVTRAEEIGWGSGVRGTLRHIRALCRLQFKRLLYAWGNAGGLLLALLSGAREYTEPAVSDAFKNAGLSHILALSGMHLSLVSGLALVLEKRAAGRRLSAVLQVGAILFFVWFAGLSPSLFRALVCTLIPFVCAQLHLRRPHALVVLSASFLLHLMLFPSHVQSAAFMLSYGALAGILLLGEPVRRVVCARIVPQIGGALGDSFAAQVFTAPVTIRLFGTLMPVGIVASVVVSPLVTWFLYAGLAGIAISLALPFLSPAIGGILNLVYGLIRGIVVWFSGFPVVQW